MSIPNFPEFDPEITRERALDMILASIAMEELALSHIINAEGEKLQYILGTLETNRGKKPSIEEILCVNQSVSNTLEIVSQNQMLLKNKMDKALQALPCTGPCPVGPTGPQGEPGPPGPACPCPPRCSAAFKGENKCEIWHSGCALPWNNGNIHGKCVCRDADNSTKILLCSKGRFMVNFAVNVNPRSRCHCDICIVLQMSNAQHYFDIFTFKSHMSCTNTTTTISMGGIIVDNFDCHDSSSIQLKLVSSDSLMVEDSMLSIVEI